MAQSSINSLAASPDGLVQYTETADTSTSVSSLQATFNYPVVSGDILVAMVNDEGGPSSNTIKFSDSRVSTWHIGAVRSDGTITVSNVSYGVIGSGGVDTVTATFSQQTRYVVLSIWEISGYSTSTVTQQNSGYGSSFSVPSVNIPANSFVLAGVAADSAGTWSGTTGFTLTSGVDWGFEYTTSPPSSTTAGMSATGATYWSEVFIAFSQSTPPPPGVGIVQNQYSFTGSTSVSQLQVALNSPVTASNILVAMANVEGHGAGSTFTISDTLNSAWSSGKIATDNVITKSEVYYAPISSSRSDTITISFSPTVTYAVLTVWEITGYSALNPVIQPGSGSSGCCSVAQASPALNSFALAGAAVDSAGSWTGTSGFKLYTGVDWGVEYTTSSPTSTTASMSASSSTYWSELFISFHELNTEAWVKNQYSYAVQDIATKGGYTLASPDFYTVNYNYQSGVAYWSNCAKQSVGTNEYECTNSGTNSWCWSDGSNCETASALASTINDYGKRAIPLIYGGSGNYGIDQGIINIITNVNGAENNFITSMISEAQTEGYGGYNLDWEWCGSGYATDLTNFVQTFAADLHNHGMILTDDLYWSMSTGQGCSFDVKGQGQYVDTVILEDYTNSQTTFNTNFNDFINTSVSLTHAGISVESGNCNFNSFPPPNNCNAGTEVSEIVSNGLGGLEVWPAETPGVPPSGDYLSNDGLTTSPYSTNSWYGLGADFLAGKTSG